MNIFAISGLINAIGVFILGSVVYLKNRTKEINIQYSLFCLFVAIWSFCYFLWQAAQDKNIALFWARGLMAGAVFIPLPFLHFVLLLLERYEKQKRTVKIGYVIFSFFFLSNFTPWFVNDVRPKMFFKFWPDPGPLFAVFLLIWFWYCMYPCYLLIKDYKKFTGIKRQQIKYVLIGILIGYGSGSTNYFLWYNIPIPPFGNFIVPLFVSMMAYAVIRHRLMDINIVITRLGIFIVVYALILGIPLILGYKYNLWTVSRWIMLLLSAIGPFIFLFLQRQVENILRKEQLEYQKKLRNASSTMMLSKDLDVLLKVIVLNAVDIVKVKWAGVYLKDDKQLKYLLKHHRSREAKIDLPKEFTDDSDFVKRLYKSRLPLIGEEIHSHELKVGLSIPCFIDSNMIGFLLLGDKPKDKLYDQSDVNEFALLANQVALAIENCQFYYQERQYQQYLRVSSLDKQMAGLAHEIDNPNAAMLSALGSLELALDDLKDSIPPDKMEYVKKKIERARFNSKRISKMITSVREFSRSSTGEIKPIKFEWIMEGFLSIIEPQFKYNGVNFTQQVPNEVIWLRANKVEIEQVLVNLSINSIQAINEIWLRGENTPESKKEVSFKAYKIDSSILRIDFSDTGSGITKEMLEQLFLDFVTTKGSAEGTGLGLSISRRNIQKHNGKIWAESEGKNKGATFHIELPIANDLTEEEKQRAEAERGGQGKKDMFIQDFPK